ncbi:TIGR03749 family integrating conjugative element protein [Photobacterium leiognathi]|uniref:TIGR03749 family integrating conjugative element protein n=2 Tax=Photobacterium leiognathi TaxID=553611 RepID=UPI002982885F|nr:TIGR03749 family integrating conjugative element protein [Photobacterium leiognathi]
MRIWIVLLMSICSLSSHATTPPTDRIMAWEGIPLPITLAVGKETLITFDSDVRVGVPSGLYSQARIDALRGTVYITANRAFETQRLQVERLRDGLRMLIDIRAQEGVTHQTHIDIVTADEKAAMESAKATQKKQAEHVAALRMPIPALLVRYAYQNIYSPHHAIEPLPGVSRIAMQLDKDIQAQAFPLWPVTATPVAAWFMGDYTVTAITLTHKNSDTMTIDPRQVTADAYAVSFAFPDMGPAMTDSAMNTAFIVTKGPLADRLPPRFEEVTP